ncbi:uncharacterized protein PV09_00885 [Verruconis gallopava]|uniref:protein-histidine N-methyltransferase n=1 Tax=Verruconis gallopava TaxID=253628 RepID=A0A0D1Z7P8_9PEZI|nr:uncharacterized protein PV09_00885 [Verruconis gallopava]KIW08977.1 hypothetical protein PV09_00885 [Verruconis gallopava]
MSFSFGFEDDDDIESTDTSKQNAPVPKNTKSTQNEGQSTSAPEIARSHKIEDLLSSLPSKIAYSFVEIESPKGRKVKLPRRELFDIRLQLMAEDDGDENEQVSLDESDIRTNVYEGGYKSWECSFDLAKLLLDRGPRKDLDDLCRVDHVVELGCGTSIPSLILFHYAITEGLGIYFTLTDYNASVLRLVTLPNLLLTWASTLPATDTPFSPESPNPLKEAHDNGDLEITPELVEAFLSALRGQGITINLISGSWSPSRPFLSLIPTAPEMNILCLASETIYSPAALVSFTEALIGILKQVRMGKGIVAAKKMYFGVGGSVDAFKIECRERQAVAYEIENHNIDLGQHGGVRRSLVEVQML